MKKNVSLTVILISIVAVIGKLFGFLREILMAKFFGTSNVVDIYLISITIPTILFGFLPALAVGYTPIFFQIKSKLEKAKFTNSMICVSLVISIFCVFITYLFNENIVSFIANGFSLAELNLTSKFLRITIWLIVFNTPIQLLIAFLNCNEMYVFSNVTNLVLSLIQSLFVVIAGTFDILFLPWGILIAYILQFMFLILFSYGKGYRFKFTINFNENIKKVFILTIPIFISNILVDLNGFIDKYLASSLYEGSIASLNYAFTLRSVFFLVCTSSIGTIFYPKISQIISENNTKKLAILVTKVINILLILFIPITIGGILLSSNIIKLVLMRGNFDIVSLNLTVSPFIMYMISLTFIAIRDLIIKIFYAEGDSRSNLYFGLSSLLVNILLSLLLIKKIGHVGLALGTSLSAIITFPCYMVKLKKIISELSYKKILKNVFKIICGCIPMIIFILCYNYGIKILFGDISKFMLFILTTIEILISIIMYISTICLLKIDGSSIIWNFINKFIKGDKYDKSISNRS